jgi:phage tail sheath protein FI
MRSHMPDYRTPGVYIEEVSAGPRPIQASSTTETGFVAFVTVPAQFSVGRGKATGLLLPVPEEQAPLTWTRALAFRPLALEVDAAPAAAPALKPMGTVHNCRVRLPMRSHWREAQSGHTNRSSCTAT